MESENFDDIITEKKDDQEFKNEMLQELKNLKAKYQLTIEDKQRVIIQLSRYNSHLENFIQTTLSEQEARLQDLESQG